MKQCYYEQFKMDYMRVFRMDNVDKWLDKIKERERIRDLTVLRIEQNGIVAYFDFILNATNDYVYCGCDVVE